MPQEKEEQERKVRTNLLGCPHFDDDALHRYYPMCAIRKRTRRARKKSED